MVKHTNKSGVATCQYRLSGYTMIELMVVLAIAAILATSAVPGLKDSIDRNGREAAMQTLMTAIGVARSEAVSQGRLVSICRSTDQATCANTTGADWDDGWIVFSDVSPYYPASAIGTGDAILRVYGPSNDQSVITLKTRLNGSFTGDYLQFDADGVLSNTTATTGVGAYFKFCAKTNVATKTRAIWLSATGRPTFSAAVANGATQKDLAGVAMVCP